MNIKTAIFRPILAIIQRITLIILVASFAPFLEIKPFFSVQRRLSNLAKAYKRLKKVRLFHKSSSLLEKQSKIKFKNNQQTYPLFSRSTEFDKALCSLIDNEQKKIRIATYMLTDYNVINALSGAKKRGIDVEVIVDSQSLNFNNLDDLKKHNVPVFVHKTKTHGEKMHHKIALFFQNNILGALYNLVWLGSYNFTFSGSKKNVESVIVTRNKKLFKSCASEFEAVKKESRS